MRRVTRITLLGFALSLASTLSTLPAVESPFDESIIVQRVLWPVFFESRRERDAAPGDCAAMTVDDIRVTEDGEPVAVTHLDSQSVRAIHAILIDTSFSMEPRLEQAKEAALRYVRRTAPREAVLVATFDDSLILRSPPTRDVARLERAIESIDLGRGTDLWGSVYHLIRYLEPFSGQKVVVLLSDGNDTHGARADTLSVARWYAGTSPNLAIYPVGLQIPDEDGYVAPLARFGLRMLARITGGRFLIAKSVTELDGAFSEIRDVVSHKQFLTYIPPPFGEGPEDDPVLRPYRMRRVKIHTRLGAPCRAVSAGPEERFEGRRSALPDLMRELEQDELAAAGATLTTSCSLFGGERALRAGFALPEDAMPLWGEVPPSRLFLLNGSSGIVAQIYDVVRETGRLYDAASLAAFGTFEMGKPAPPAGRLRGAAIDVAPLEDVRRGMTRPLDVLLRLLELDGCRENGRDGAVEKPPLLVNGSTFLELRRYLGQLLFDRFPDYREWASSRFQAEIEAEAEGLLTELERSGLRQDRRSAVMNALLHGARNPKPEQPQRLLADWLADVPVASLASDLERWAMNEYLSRGASSAAKRPAFVTEMEQAWRSLAGWFPPPSRERVLTPLILAYDPERDRFGFFRFVLPRLRFERPPSGRVPPAPLALRTLRALVEDEGLENRTGWRAGAIRYAAVEGAALASIASELVRGGVIVQGERAVRVEAHEVSFELLSSSGSRPALKIVSRFARLDGVGDAGSTLSPICRTVTTTGGDEASDGPLARLAVRLAGNGPRCSFL